MRKQLGKLVAIAAALVSASSLWAISKGPDAGSYTATDGTVYSFIDLVAGGGSVSVLSGSDDAVALLTLPFPFQFYGKSYTLVCVSSNGLMSFVTSADACSASVDFANVDLTSSAPPGDAPSVLPYWTDLTFGSAGGGAVYYQTLGAAGSRKFVVEWANASPPSSSNPVTFEAVLYEGSNKILFQYQTVDLGAGDPATKGGLATVGIRDTGGNSNNKQIAWSFNAAVLGNSTAILFTPPASAQTSVNTITSSPTGLTVTIDGVAYPTPKVVSWTPGTNHTVSLVTPQVNGGIRNTFTAWSPGGATPQMQILAPATGTTYTANFTTEYQLTTSTNPAAGGSVTPASGWIAAGNIVSVKSNPAANYALAFFSGALAGATNPQNLTMDAPKTVVANMQSTANPILTASVIARADAGVTGQRVWTIRLTDNGAGPANSAQITGLTLTQTSGGACTPPVVTPFPITLGTISPAANATGAVTINFASCTDAAARFSAKINFAANSGAYSGSTTIVNQVR
jgi:hypothetical protein